MSRADTPTYPNITYSPPPLSPEDLARVEDALEGVHLAETKADGGTSNIPPPVFSAGGPM